MNVQSWADWCDAVWHTLYRQRLSGFCAFEQIALRSAHEKRCHRCGDPGDAYYPPGVLLASTGYYLCKECNEEVNA